MYSSGILGPWDVQSSHSGYWCLGGLLLRFIHRGYQCHRMECRHLTQDYNFLGGLVLRFIHKGYWCRGMEGRHRDQDTSASGDRCLDLSSRNISD